MATSDYQEYLQWLWRLLIIKKISNYYGDFYLSGRLPIIKDYFSWQPDYHFGRWTQLAQSSWAILKVWMCGVSHCEMSNGIAPMRQSHIWIPWHLRLRCDAKNPMEAARRAQYSLNCSDSKVQIFECKGPIQPIKGLGCDSLCLTFHI